MRKNPICPLCGIPLIYIDGSWYCKDSGLRFNVNNGRAGHPIWWDYAGSEEGEEEIDVEPREVSPRSEQPKPEKKEGSDKSSNWNVYLRQMGITPEEYQHWKSEQPGLAEDVQKAFSLWLQGEPVEVGGKRD